MVNSRNKGASYERHVAGLFKAEGYEARRGQQFCGINGDADVVGIPGIHIECKARESLSHSQLYDAMAQAKRDAREGEIPVVIHKKNYCADLVTMEFSEWIKLYRERELDELCDKFDVKERKDNANNNDNKELLERNR